MSHAQRHGHALLLRPAHWATRVAASASHLRPSSQSPSFLARWEEIAIVLLGAPVPRQCILHPTNPGVDNVLRRHRRLPPLYTTVLLVGSTSARREALVHQPCLAPRVI